MMLKILCSLFVLFYFNLINAQLSDLVKGKYLCTYIKSGASTIADSGNYSVWVVSCGPDSIYVFDSLHKNFMNTPSLPWIKYPLVQMQNDSIKFSDFLYGTPSLGDIEKYYFYQGDKISLYQRDYVAGMGVPPYLFYTYSANGFHVDSITPFDNLNIDSINHLVSVTPLTYRSLKLYPQPAQHELFVSEMPQGKKTLALQDLLGKVVWSKESLLESEVIDLSALQKGMYLLVVEAEGKRFTEKVLKE